MDVDVDVDRIDRAAGPLTKLTGVEWEEYCMLNRIEEDRDDSMAAVWLLPPGDDYHQRVDAACDHLRELGVNGICETRYVYSPQRIGFLVHSEDRDVYSYEQPEDNYVIYCIHDEDPSVEILVAATLLNMNTTTIGQIRSGYYD